MSTLLIIIAVLVFLIMIVAIVRTNSMYYNDYDDEIVTHTTVTTTTTTDNSAPATTGLNINGIPIVGMLQRQWENNQPFVMDPVDKDKIWLNTTDDIYEDGAGKMWGLQ